MVKRKRSFYQASPSIFLIYLQPYFWFDDEKRQLFFHPQMHSPDRNCLLTLQNHITPDYFRKCNICFHIGYTKKHEKSKIKICFKSHFTVVVFREVIK